MPEKRTLIIHPYILAIYPILFFLNLNRTEVWFSEVLVPIAVSLAATYSLFSLLKIAFREVVKAGALTSLILILFFSYEAITAGIAGNDTGDLILNLDPHLFWSYGILLALATIGINFWRGQSNKVTEYLNVMSIVLIAFPLYSLANHEISNKESDLFFRAASDREALPVNFKQSDPKPDIYYIIMDAYLRDDVMNEFWGIDNSGFIKFLTNRGFYVAPKSRSNYQKTLSSLASSLNMEYLPTDLDEDTIHQLNNTPLIKAIEGNRVADIFKSMGYLYVHLSDSTAYTKRKGQADVVITNRKYISHFSQYLLNKTFFKSLKLNSLDRIKTKRNNILYGFKKLVEISKNDAPTFTLAHFIMPHGPQAFDKNGAIPIESKKEIEKYFDELLYANKKITNLVDRILENSKIPPIILIQGDHGYPQMRTAWPDAAGVKKRYSNLSAYYFPGDGKAKLYETITPVNSFRLIFDHYFGAQFGLLKDKSYLAVPDTKDRKFFVLPSEDSLNNNGVIALLNSLEQAVLKKPDFAEAHAMLGKYYSVLKRNSEAISSLEKALQLDPDLVFALLHLARAYSKAKNYSKAIDLIHRVIRMSQETDVAHVVLGHIQFESGNYEEALSAYNKTLESYPNSLDAIYGIAHIYYLLNQKEKSLSYSRKAVLLDPSFNGYNNLGVVYYHFGLYEDAILNLKKALEINSSSVATHYNLGNALLKNNQIKASLLEAQETIRLSPGHIPSYLNLGFCQFQLGQIKQARETYEAVLLKEPENAGVHKNLGMIYSQNNENQAKTVFHLQKYLHLAPNQPDTAQIQSMIQALRGQG
jgi:tetratricopeptide (TPR) repeat protein